MKKIPFYMIFFITQCVLSIIVFAVIQYSDFDTTGIGSPVTTAIVVSILPSVLISIWWWNIQDED